MKIEISYPLTKKRIVHKYYRMIWWFENKKWRKIPCLLLGHKWEFWNLLNAYKCSRCGDPKSWYEQGSRGSWGRGYYEDKQYMKYDNQHKEAIRGRKTLPDGSVGQFNSRGERIA